jgi:hypothetical protein
MTTNVHVIPSQSNHIRAYAAANPDLTLARSRLGSVTVIGSSS